MTPDDGARYLTGWLGSGLPFFFARIGDGAVECVTLAGTHTTQKTCDGELYTLQLAIEVNRAIEILLRADNQVVWGDWRTAVAGSPPQHVEAWEKMVDAPNRQLCNYESLLLMRESDALRNFYSVLRADRRRKLYIGRDFEASKLLNCYSQITTPMNLGDDVTPLRNAIAAAEPELIIFGAGMAGLAAVTQYWNWHRSDCSAIHLGSALDPYFGHRSRSNQLTPERARAFLNPICQPLT